MQRLAQSAGDFLRELRLAGARLALDEQGRASVTAAFTAIMRSSVAM